jgi:probable phosphoglycerate mutase
MKIYFVRHGESEANILKVFSNRDVKHDLTDTGRMQAEKLGKELSGIRFARFYSSPVYRATRTADILGKSLGFPGYITDEGLREFDVGRLEGKTGERYWKEHITLWEDWLLRGFYERRHSGGENHYDIRKRFSKWLDPLAAEFKDTDENILAVTHGALLMTMMPFVLDNISPEFSYGHLLPNTAVILAEYVQSGLTCRRWSDIEFK